MKKQIVLRMSALFMSVLLLTALFASYPASAEPAVDKLTIMIYMTGSDLESGYGAATNDITEMLRAHTDTDRVNLIVMTGGSAKWWGGFPNDRTVIYEINGRRPTEVWSSDVMNMAESSTLSTFINFGYASYPAEDYALILWNHGGGPLMGVCADELHKQSGVSDMLDMVELQTALAASPCASQPFEWIGFDACLMSSVETAYMCAPYAKYMIASQEVEPGSGWNYAFLSGISSDPDGAATGTRIVDAYFDSFGASASMYPLTLACIDLSKIGDVELMLDGMFSQINGVLNETSFSMLSNKRRDTRALGRASTGSEYDLVDLYNLTQQYSDQAPEAAASLMTAIDEAVIYRRTNIQNTNGLSVYYPYYNKDYYTCLWETEYSRLFFAPGYTNYLKNFASIWLGNSITSWFGLRANTLAPLPETETTITMELTDEQLANFAGAELYVMSHDATIDQYSFVYSTPDVTLDGNTLTASYNNRALYVIDEDGNPLTGSIEYHVTEDTYLVRAVLMEGANAFDGATMPVYLQLKPVEGTDELQAVGIIDLTEDLGLNSGKQNATLDSEVWHTISVIRYPACATYDENGQILPFSQWDDSPWVFADYFSVDQPWKFRFVEENYNTDQFAAMITVTDTQGNEYASDMTALPNHNLEPFDINPCVLIDNDAVTIELTGAYYSIAAYDPGLRFQLRTTNKTGEEINVNAGHIISDNLVISATSHVADSIAPGETVETMMDLPAYELYNNNITSMNALSFELTVFNENLDSLCVENAIITGPIDLAPIMPAPPASSAPATQPAEDSLSIELFDITDNGDGTYTGWMRYANNSAIDYDTTVSDVIINGFAIQDLFLHTLWLPAGTTVYEQLTISPEIKSDTFHTNDLPHLEKPFAYWGIDAIESMSVKVGDPDYNYTYVDVTIPGAITVSDASEPAATYPLYEDDRMYVGIKQLNCDAEYQNANILLHVTNKTDAPLPLGFDSISINGTPTYTGGEMDTAYVGYLGYEPVELRPGVTERLLLEISADDFAEAELTDISFCMYFEDTDGSMTYTQPITLTLPEGLTLAACPESGVSFEEMTISEFTESGSISPADLICDTVQLPENFADCVRTFSAELTETQAEAFSQGQLIIMQKFADPDGGEIYRIHTAADSLTLDGTTVSGKYSGLLLSPADDPEMIITTVEDAHPEGEVSLHSSYIYICDAGYQLDSIPIHSITIIGSAPEASVVSVSSDFESIRDCNYSLASLWYYDVKPEYDENGALVHYSKMHAPNITSGSEIAFDNNALQLEFRAATSEDNLWALFAIWNADGSGYCLEPIPLD